MNKELKPVPYFKTEAEERLFWETHSSIDYVDWRKAKRVQFPNLNMSTPEELARATESAEAKDSAAAN